VSIVDDALDAITRETRTHDYTRRTWGHDYFINHVEDGGVTLKAGGWGHGIDAGDYLVLPNKRETTRYRVVSIRYERDPADMWFAELRFAPRTPGTSGAEGGEP
jgi:hypothetical protein